MSSPPREFRLPRLVVLPVIVALTASVAGCRPADHAGAAPATTQAASSPRAESSAAGATSAGAAAAASPTSTAPALEAFEDPASGRWGLRDAAGTVVVTPRFDHVDGPIAGGLSGAVLAGTWVWIDGGGTVLPLRPFVFDNGTDPFVEGLARYVDEAGRLGFVAPSGEVAIAARFAFVHPFAEGRAAFCEGCRLERPEGDEHTQIVGGLWGFVDPRGEVVIPARYTQVSDFEQGVSKVCTPDGGCQELRPDGSVIGEAS